jgi:hypothetical protein
MSGVSNGKIAYHFAVLHVVPHVYIGACVPVGVIVHARTSEFLGLRVVCDTERLARQCEDVDVELLIRYLRSCEAICRGDASAGPVALTPTSERFHWLTAPRSDVIRCGPVHEGLTTDPTEALETLFARYFPKS